MEFKCNCHNSGTNSFTGHCDRCGMIKPSNGTIVTINTGSPQKTLQELFNSTGDFRYKALELLEKVLELPRYNPEPKNDWVEMIEEKEGEYVELEDIISLFGAKKE